MFVSISGRESLLARQVNHIFPPLGAKPIHQVTAPELLDALRQVENRVSPGAAHRTLQDCGRIFRYAIATGRAERDTAADLRGALTPVRGGNYATITDPKAVRDLLHSIDGYNGYFPVLYALRMAPLVFVRPGELRKAEWKEFDLTAAEWRIPAARMKMRQVHIVPLARQMLELLRELHPHTGYGKYLFPSVRTDTRPISDVTLLAALRRMGFTKAEMTVHGFRALASTLLNERGQSDKPKVWQIGDLVDYIRNPRDTNAHEKVAHAGGRNFFRYAQRTKGGNDCAYAGIRPELPV